MFSRLSSTFNCKNMNSPVNYNVFHSESFDLLVNCSESHSQTIDSPANYNVFHSRPGGSPANTNTSISVMNDSTAFHNMICYDCPKSSRMARNPKIYPQIDTQVNLLPLTASR